MNIYRHLDELPPNPAPAVATIGNFDGVHRGHGWVIGNVISRARLLGARSLVVTFDPHPSRALRPGSSLALLTPLSHKLDLLAATGVDDVLVLPFTADIARMGARDFAHDILHTRLNIVELHEGEDFRFGYRAEGNIDTLKALTAEFGSNVVTYAPQSFHGAPVSSSRIRALISAGDVSVAHRLLHRPFSLRGTPAPGRGYGTRYTVPTINLAPYPELLPAHGVYITRLRIGSGASAQTFDAVTNVGNRPTFGADSFTIESHLLNFHPVDLSESTPLDLCFLHRLRDEQRFPSPALLLDQIKRDLATSNRFFSLLSRLQAVPSKPPPASP